jgi:serine/threonine protein kinase
MLAGVVLRSAKKSNTPLRMNELLNYACQIADGAKYLASVCWCYPLTMTPDTYQIRVIHRDLAVRNVLVTEFNQCRIGDFGLTRFVFLLLLLASCYPFY